MHARLLLTFSLCAAACGQNTDTSLSDGATQGSSGSTGATTSEPQTGGLTGGVTEGLSEASSGGASNSGTGSTGEPGTGTGEPGTSTSTSTGEPGTSSTSTTLTTGEPGSTSEPFGTTGDPGTTGGSESTGAIDDCAELKAAYAAEAKKITACTVADECGQQLTGTSCGCTRDWVARLDADTDHFYALMAMADGLRCELVLAGTCDCPEADGFACQAGTCTWNYL